MSRPRLSAPSAGEAREIVDAHAATPLNYEPLGLIDTDPPRRWTVNHHRVQLGRSEDVFAQAVAALRSWQMLPSWSRVHPPNPPVSGAVMAVEVRRLGVRWLAPVRVVRLIDEPGRVGFVWGTLMGHPLRGEERFSVEVTPDGDVWYDLRSVSRPAAGWLRLASGALGRTQRRFALDSLETMRRSADR